jgi:hypothetical protein
MAALKEEHKLLIVQALACFDTPTQVAESVKEEFGIELTRQQVARYDPTKVAGGDLSKKLRAVFEETRKAFLESTASIPIAQQSFRLRALQRLYEKALKSGNVVLAAQYLEQAAKESGGLFTNKQRLEHAGPNGGPIEQKTTVVDETAVAAQVAKLQGDY